MSRPLLVLRPEPGASATAARADALGFDVCLAPLFRVASVAWTPPEAERFDALMLTSANAVRHAGAALDRYRALPLYAVGQATADAAAAAGFDPVLIGSADAQALLAEAAANGVRRLLHLCGQDHRDASHPDVQIDRCIVYAADGVALLPEAAREALLSGAIALLHSPRAAALFARLVDDAGLHRRSVRLVALSPAVARAARGGWAVVGTAPEPHDDALLAVAARMCE
ncbi:MAG: uroporphyrinogen III synthase HEM4 [Candidatus Accumulibacter sp.]|nr:uroporphyrinogen III synthase HEM4 [Accumulibacter sp.]